MIIYDIPVKTIDGESTTLSTYKNQVLLIVNVASECGYTSQYEELEELQQRFNKKGFNVLAFPCNQFRNQEPGTEAEIKEFCTTTYKTTFPLFSKIEVNGGKTHSLFRFLKHKAPGFLGTESIKWNFTKFLVNRDGEVVRRFAPSTTPLSIVPDIEELIAEENEVA